MAKSDILRRNDAKPAITNGELVPVASVVQITNLTVAGPFTGDLQITGGGRLIVGANPDLGARIIVSERALLGYNNNSVNTFSLWSSTFTDQGGTTHYPGDLHLGNLAANYLAYDQSTGTLGLYTPQGAGFIARRDGTLQAGLADGAHMLWNAGDQALQIRYGEDVKIDLGADGNASFDGTIYASGGRIYGTLAVDDVLRAGDVDGPAVYLGRFERDTGTEIIETSEIIATDDQNLPWFHVVAGGETLPGYFHLGGTGQYAQHLNYDGTTLELDGTIYAQAGSFTGTVSISGNGALTWGDGQGRADTSGISLRAYDIAAGPNGNRNRLRFIDNLDRTLSWLGCYYSATADSVFVRADGIGTGRNGIATIQAVVDTGQTGESNIAVEQGSDSAYMAVYVDAAGATSAAIKADEINIGDGGTTNYLQISATGDVSLFGSARYERHIQLDAKADGTVGNQPTQVDFFTVGGLQYPTTGAKYDFTQWEIPDDWDGADVYFEIDWFPDSGAISGTSAVRWTVEYRAIAEGEAINNGTSVTLDNGAGGDTADYSQYQTKHTRFTMAYNSALQPLTKQDHVYFKISRDTGVTNDFGGSVTVSAYEIIYTSTGFPTSN